MKKELKFSRMKTGVLIILLILVFSANLALGGLGMEKDWSGFNTLAPSSIEFKEGVLTVIFMNYDGGVRINDISINYRTSECDVIAELGKPVEFGDTFTVKALNCAPEEFEVLKYYVSINYTYLPNNTIRTTEGSIWVYPEEPVDEGINFNILTALVAVGLIVFAYYVKKKHGSEKLIKWYVSLFTLLFFLFFILFFIWATTNYMELDRSIGYNTFGGIIRLVSASMSMTLISIAPSVFARHNTKETITLVVFILISLYFTWLSQDIGVVF